MPQEKSRTLRVLVPLILVGLAVALFARGMWKSSGGGNAPAGTPAGGGGAPTAPERAGEVGAPTTPVGTGEGVTPPATAPSDATPDGVPAAATRAVSAEASAGHTPAALRARTFDAGVWANVAALGRLDAGGSVQVEFAPTGAGLGSVRLAEHFETIRRETHVVVQGEHVRSVGGVREVLTPLAVLWLDVDGQVVALAGTPETPVWRPVDGRAHTFEAFVEEASSGEGVLRIERAYSLAEGSYELIVRQRIENVGPSPRRVALHQLGIADAPKEELSYGGDRRRASFGYLLPASEDPTQSVVRSGDADYAHPAVLGPKGASGGYVEELKLWPNKSAIEGGLSLVWGATANRYFGAAVMPVLADASGSKRLAWVARVGRVVMEDSTGPIAALRLDGEEGTIAPGAGADHSLALFAGPLDRKLMRSGKITSLAGLEALVVYNMGGMCAFCTFAPVARLLLSLLRALHDYVVFDWALAIMVLVLIVRTLLHPVTRWSQIRLGRFGKQMQGIAPKQKALQERYKDNQQKLREETAKLWREEGISPAGMLGCLPPFLQMPVWIALYATLFLAVELRHEAAFFGVFQKLGHTWFMADLSRPDNLIHFGRTIHIPLLSGLLGPIDGLNILPLLLGVVFFIQQKYMSPATAPGSMTPEQEMQQKMIKWMSVVMFPLFMYNAPCGLSLYFTVNSTLGILESRWIRAHMNELDKKGPPAKRKPGGGSWMQRVMEAAEQRRKAMEAAQSRAQQRRR